MATIKELFMGEFKYGALASDITFSDGDGVTACKADARLYLAFEEYACFLAYYVSEEDATAQKLGILLHQYEDSLRLLRAPATMTFSHPVYDPAGVSSRDLPFTGRVIFYIDAALDEGTKQGLIATGASTGSRHI
jgi:hypothetical protein